MKPRTVALIPAAGKGQRMGGPLEKQFMHMSGRPLLARTLEPFQRSPWIEAIVLVVPGHWVEPVWEAVIRPHGLAKVRKVVHGGPRRQDSVRLGVEALEPEWDLVLIHDGARPLVSEEVIQRSVEETWTHGATLVGVPATDTITEIDAEGFVLHTLERDRLWMVQTPQTFRYEWLLRAHIEARRDGFTGTDDASLVERLGIRVRVIPGSYKNIKVTTVGDLALAERILAQRDRG